MARCSSRTPRPDGPDTKDCFPALEATDETVSPEIGLRLVAGLLLILANGFSVTIEFALTRVRQYPESEFDEPGLRRAWNMTDDLEIFLTSCQVGITASSIAVGIVAEPANAHLVEPVFAGSNLAGIGMG